jgi:hypothetical protein
MDSRSDPSPFPGEASGRVAPVDPEAAQFVRNRPRFSSAVRTVTLGFLAVYVLSNTTFLHESGVLYFGRHLALVAVAFLGVVWWLERASLVVLRRYVVFAFALYAVSAPYLLRFVLTFDVAEFGVFLQHVIFGLAVITLCVALERAGEGTMPRAVVVLLAMTFGVAAWVALVAPHYLFNTYWGRPRLLLGFYHPKQVGTLLTTTAFLALTLSVLGVRRRLNLFLFLTLLGVLLLVDSRNMFLFSFLFGASYLVAAIGGYFSLVTLWALGGAAIVWGIIRYPLLMDLATSGRLAIWRGAEYSLFGRGARFEQAGGSGIERFHIDNFYIAYTLENGVYAIVLVPALVGLVGYLLMRTPDSRWRRLKVSAALSFLFVCAWDAGMFSTGNLVNIAVWTYLLCGERIFPSGGMPHAALERSRLDVPPQGSLAPG